MFEDTVFRVGQAVVVGIEDGLGLLQIDVLVATLVPGKCQDPVDVVADHRRLGAHGRHHLELADFLLAALPRLVRNGLLGERGFEQAKSYYEDYVPARSREDSWDRPAISWPSRAGLSKGELELLRGEIIRQGSPACRRDLAILDVAYSAGLDLKSLSALTIRDIRNNWFAIWLGGRYQYTGEMRTRNISWKARWSLKGYCTGSRKRMVSKGSHHISRHGRVFVTEDGKSMTGTMMLTMLRDYAAGVGITTGIGLNTLVISRGRHMQEDGYSLRHVRQFFRDSNYPEAETGDYNDRRSQMTCSYPIDPRLSRR